MKFLISVIICAALVPSYLSAQTRPNDFGQNRVQYKHFEWSFFESDNFNTYYYIGGQDIGKFVIQAAEKNLESIIEKLDFRLNRKIEILVYADITDLNQTNIGVYNEDQNIGGATRIVENKLFVFFNGDHRDLQKQIRQGIARIYIAKMMVGVNFQEVLQNAVLLNLPNWFTDGLIDYIGEDWSVEDENKLRDAMLSGRFNKMNNLSADDARFVGHSFWKYVEAEYGEAAVPNLLYLTRINRSLESGFLFVLGNSVSVAFENWYKHYYERFKKESEERTFPSSLDEIDTKIRKKRHYNQLKINTDGKKMAFVTNQMGKWKVFVETIKSGNRIKVAKGGFKTQTLLTDFSYPLLSWSPDGRKLAVIYEKRDQIYLMQYDIRRKTKTIAPITKFQKVFNFSYGADSKNLVMSAMQKGQVDIFTYFIPSTRVQKITNDFYDDLDPAYVDIDGQRGIMFSSNRKGDTLKTERIDTLLPTGSFDLFFYNLDTESDVLSRISQTPFTNERKPMQYSATQYSFLSDQNGVQNRFVGNFERVFDHNRKAYFYTNTTTGREDSMTLHENRVLDSVIDVSKVNVTNVETYPVYKFIGSNYPVTDYNYNISEYDIAGSTNQVIELYNRNNTFEIYRYEFDTAVTVSDAPYLQNTGYRQQYIRNAQEQLKEQMHANKAFPEPEINVTPEEIVAPPETTEEEPKDEDYYFQSDFDFPNTYVQPDSSAAEFSVFEIEDPNVSEQVFKLSKVRPYFVKFATDEIVTQFDNSIIMNRYDKFNPQNPVFNNPTLGFLVKIGITDLFEDHRIYGGFRIPVDFNTTEYFVTYENLKKRWDKSFTYYRKSTTETSDDFVPFTTTPIPVGDSPLEYKVKTNYFETRYKYPIDVLKSIRFGLSFRNDRFVYRSEDLFSLEQDSYSENWAIASAEFVHDNTIDVAMNIKNGTRYRFFTEIHKQIPTKRISLFDEFDISIPQVDDAFLAVIGADFRHYQKIHKQIIWANRVAWSSSIGNRKLIYYLGGVDGWIPPGFDRETPVNQDNNYAFQTVATNMRGFDQNIRNGNNYVLVNSEIRIPVFSYLINSPIRSDFIKNFQIVPFADIGTAWEGLSPFSQDNPLFTRVYGGAPNPVKVTINYYRNPIVAGYGVGARTMLLGYFIRVDAAWGWDSGEVTGLTWHFSLNLDF